jgi:two-component system, cell cycle sensor histidine kinase and response regulator CckA
MVLSVADTGIALTSREEAALFEPYVPGRTGGKGRGLGLSLVYAIAQRCGGVVRVVSHPERGTEFRVFFPARDTTSIPASAPTPIVESARPSSAETASGVSILIAEDDDGLRALATKVLSREGYTVFAARDGQEAVELFERERERVRLVVLDDVMPRMGGRAALARIRQSAKAVPAILCSGYTWSLDGQSQESGGFSCVLPKPWQPRELLRRVREGLEIRS